MGGWRLRRTLLYTGVSVGILLSLVFLGSLAVNEVLTAQLPDLLSRGLDQRASQAAPYLATRPADVDGAAAWLRRSGDTVIDQQVSETPHTSFTVAATTVTVVVDASGAVVASHGGALPAAAAPLVRRALADTPGVASLPDGSVVAARPVHGRDGGVIGAIATDVRRSDQLTLLAESVGMTATIAVPLALISALVGAVFAVLGPRAPAPAPSGAGTPDPTPSPLRDGAARAPAGHLTRREREVLALIAAGRDNRAIARALAISEQTVKKHVSSILGKLCVADRTQAAVYAWREGLIVGVRPEAGPTSPE